MDGQSIGSSQGSSSGGVHSFESGGAEVNGDLWTLVVSRSFHSDVKAGVNDVEHSAGDQRLALVSHSKSAFGDCSGLGDDVGGRVYWGTDIRAALLDISAAPDAWRAAIIKLDD